MIRYGDVRSALRDRLAEEGQEFWTDSSLLRYVNLAQTFIASVTRGVDAEVVAPVGGGTSSFSLPARTLSAHLLSGYDLESLEAMGTISVADANLISPSWRRMVGVRPKWFILDLPNREAHVSPIPWRERDVSLRVSVLPEPVAASGDELYNSQDVMDKYFNVTVNMAAVYAFLRERFDGDAERFYSLVYRELQDLGINPASIPEFREVETVSGSDGG